MYFYGIKTSGQTDSQVRLLVTVWPGLVCTWIDLQWLALTLVVAKICTQVDTSFSLFGHPTHAKSMQIEWLSFIVINSNIL